MKKIIAFLLIAILILLSFPSAISASVEESKEVSLKELMDVVKGMLYFDYFVYVSVYPYYCISDEEWESQHRDDWDIQYRNWLKENDLWMDSVNYREFDDSYGYSSTGVQLPEKVTKKSLEKVLKKYYATDFCGYLENILTPEDLLDSEKHLSVYYSLVYADGKMYRLNKEYDFAEEGNCLILDTVEILSKTSTKITLQFELEEFEGKTTVDLIKTSSGWRVSGGSLFDYMRRPGYHPPETGDSTAPYLALAALSFLALPFAAVALSRKRKRL